MGNRITRETLYLRHDFTNEEKLEMGSKLADAHNRMAEIEEEESSMKAQIKERKAMVEATIGTVARSLSSGFTMHNVDCEILYDTPNVGEKSYKRKDNGEIAKVQAMTAGEMQQELDFAKEQTENGVVVPFLVPEKNPVVDGKETQSVSESTANIEQFFGETSIDAMTAEDAGNSAIIDAAQDELAVFSSPDPAMAAEATKPEHDAVWQDPGDQPRRGRGRPKGSTNKAKELAETF